MKPNPVMLEWLSSPIRYMWDDDVCDRLTTFSHQVSHAAACLYHYRSVAAKQWEHHVEGQDAINLKKYFYILRPAMALRWIRMRPEVIPPMNFQALMEGIDLPPKLLLQIEQLLAKKTAAKETGLSPRWPDIDAFIQSELAWGFEHAEDYKPSRKNKSGEANALFRRIVKSTWA